MRRHSDPDDLTPLVIAVTVGLVLIVLLMHMRSWYYNQALNCPQDPGHGVTIETHNAAGASDEQADPLT